MENCPVDAAGGMNKAMVCWPGDMVSGRDGVNVTPEGAPDTVTLTLPVKPSIPETDT